MKVYCSIVWNTDGTVDVEFLDSEPTESFRDGLFDQYLNARIDDFQIREGNINGGDSIILFQANG